MLAWIKRHAKALGIGAFAVLALLFVLYQRCGISGCPDVDTLNGYMPDEASTIVDYRGAEIGKLYLTRRTLVPLDTLPKHVPAAFVAMGIDLAVAFAIVSASLPALRAQRLSIVDALAGR